MKLLHLPPAARVQIWSAQFRPRKLSALQPQGYTALLSSTTSPFPTNLHRRYATVAVGNNDSLSKTTQAPLKDDLPDLAPDEVSLVNDVRAYLVRCPKEESEAVLANLQWCIENKAYYEESHSWSRVLRRIRGRLDNSATPAAVQEIVEAVIEETLWAKRYREYGYSPRIFFRLEHTPIKLLELCNRPELGSKISPEVVTVKNVSNFHLHLNIPGIADDRTFGAGPSETIAKRRAWRAMLLRLDATGALPKLLYPEAFRKVLNPHGPSVAHTKLAEEIELDWVEDDIVKQEKDGISDIYNYAAKFGLVPRIEACMVTRRIRGSASSKARKVAQVSIQLPEQKIKVVSHGLGPRAVASAVLAFKSAAKKLQMQYDQVSDANNDYSSLNTSTAVEFVNMVRRLEGDFDLTFTNKTMEGTGSVLNICQLNSNGEPIGQQAIGWTVRDAEQVALLTAAIELARKSPDILSQFAISLAGGSSGKSRILERCPPVRTEVNAAALDIMEKTLLKAKQAGLSEYQEQLAAMSHHLTKFRERRLPREATCVTSERLLDRLQQFEADPNTIELRNAIAALPMSRYSSKVLDMVFSNVYSIVIGATGSGKTTQVPQIILDDAIRRSKGGNCNVICTQPRRLAAISVARRVATERDERLGLSVGYQVRGDSNLPQPGGSITYCTTGILLERLKWNADDVLDNASHLVVDEVHERDIYIDFLLIVLKKAITARHLAGKTVPKVVLMSATIDKNLFSAYLPNKINGKPTPCPYLEVPGRTFPVKEKYLDEILSEMTELHPGLSKQLAAREKDDTKAYLIAEKAFEHTDVEVNSVTANIDGKKQDELDDPRSGEKEEALVPIALLVATIAHICKISPDGAILAFLPGVSEIVATEEEMKRNHVFGLDFSNGEAFRIHLLHSLVPAEQQREIFEPLPTGCRRIILSTNIAETSITVPDVKHVVDLGKLRQNTYLPADRVTALQTVWESGSNARQRAGRAGRVSDGSYYALYSRKRREAMPESGLPELLRADLQETCLSIKAQRFEESVSSFLSAAIEPPAPEAIQFAVENLKAIEAFTEDEEMTALGGVLSKLPVHPALGKMILLGLIFRCLDPVIIIGSMYGERALFVNPPGMRPLVRASKQHFNVANSDHITSLKAFQYLRQYSRDVNQRSVRQKATTCLIHYGAFRSISQTAKQVAEILVDAGLLDANMARNEDTLEIGGEALNRNSHNYDLIKCLIVAGVYPNIAVKPSLSARSFRTESKKNIINHPSSVNALTKKDGPSKAQHIFAFTTLARDRGSDTLFMRESSLVTPLAAMLFGGHLQQEDNLVMDDWLPFEIDYRQAGGQIDTIMQFRNAKDRMLNGVFKLLADPNETDTAVNVMEIMTEGLVKALEADAVGREKDQVLFRQATKVGGKIPQELAWSNISQLYRSNNLARMEEL
ncbi:P-loop containing nucleoside triphosphate hydrolase protein [Paraphaeosphaeria sporulosa]|uniref:p-loop containing nucleoside triphosphate hydrolase protein n=1 Tax=Paraphaeosphaeria sporulosa TaxID=1460663 RepID=A0A177C1G7_9PLEO|nr:P-loop containing nucleoside triphosphate hydrolase protein [Paraphaeosphaeria sporulosa]OAG00460.1 P-loop containing nucleoside triphosphate hydrolase protein [Paraphaeosphaeria sporulosa]